MSKEILLLTTRATFMPGAEALFAQHGCHINKQLQENTATIRFPEGTIAQELFPRTSMQRNKILLPDGWCLIEILNPFNGISKLMEVPPEEIGKLQVIDVFDKYEERR